MSAPRRSNWLLAGRVAMGAFGLVVAVLLLRYARAVDWNEVMASLAAYRAGTLVWAGVFAAASFMLYCSYDLTARRYTGHHVRTGRVMAIAFVTYAMSLNLGALIGGGGFRLRLYTREGVRAGTIGRIVAFCVSTNWLGYVVLAGGLFATGRLPLPADFVAYAGVLRWIGYAMLAVAVAYLIACVVFEGRRWHVRGHVWRLPSLPLALLQFLLACSNWLLIAAILYVLLDGRIEYPTVLGTLLLSGIAAALVHVPAGLGVLEAVFIGMLGDRVDEETLLAALLAYRAVYYLAPLTVGLGIYLVLEAQGRRQALVAGSTNPSL